MTDNFPIHFLEQTASTNEDAKKMAEKGAVHGTVVWAGMQSAGRGRLGKSWTSSRGKGLYCSIILRPQRAAAEIAKIPLVAGVATAEVLAEEMPAVREKIGLKWPNDVLVGGKKIAGILAESSPFSPSGVTGGKKMPFVVLGIGVNIVYTVNDFPEGLRCNATSILLETGRREESFADFFAPFLRRLHKKILSYTALFEQGEFPAILEKWRSLDSLKGKEIECVNSGGVRVSGISLGVDDEGVLYVEDKGGMRHEVLSGDVRQAVSPF